MLIDPDPNNDHTRHRYDCPTVDATGGGSVVEGANASFTLTVTNQVVWLPVVVNYTITQTGNYVTRSNRGPRTVTIPAGVAPVTVTVTVATYDDIYSEPAGAVTVTVDAGTGYTPGTSASVTVYDNDFGQPPSTLPPAYL